MSRLKQPATGSGGAPESSSIATSSGVMSASSCAELQAALVPAYQHMDDASPADSAPAAGEEEVRSVSATSPSPSSSSHSTAASSSPTQPASEPTVATPASASANPSSSSAAVSTETAQQSGESAGDPQSADRSASTFVGAGDVEAVEMRPEAAPTVEQAITSAIAQEKSEQEAVVPAPASAWPEPEPARETALSTDSVVPFKPSSPVPVPVAESATSALGPEDSTCSTSTSADGAALPAAAEPSPDMPSPTQTAANEPVPDCRAAAAFAVFSMPSTPNLARKPSPEAALIPDTAAPTRLAGSGGMVSSASYSSDLGRAPLLVGMGQQDAGAGPLATSNESLVKLNGSAAMSGGMTPTGAFPKFKYAFTHDAVYLHFLCLFYICYIL